MRQSTLGAASKLATTDRNGLSSGQTLRRRKLLLFGLPALRPLPSADDGRPERQVQDLTTATSAKEKGPASARVSRLRTQRPAVGA